jgi:hypothetical protein
VEPFAIVVVHEQAISANRVKLAVLNGALPGPIGKHGSTTMD